MLVAHTAEGARNAHGLPRCGERSCVELSSHILSINTHTAMLGAHAAEGARDAHGLPRCGERGCVELRALAAEPEVSVA